MDGKVITFILVSLLILASGCITSKGNDANNATGDAISEPNISSGVDKVEIIHFHGTRQCNSCITVGKYAEETVNTYFSEEVKSGRVFFASINAELPENNELVSKYGATGSSLWIGVYDENGFRKEQNVNVWYKISDKQVYMDYLKGVINGTLAGE